MAPEHDDQFEVDERSSSDEYQPSISKRSSFCYDSEMDETSSVHKVQPAVFQRIPANKNPFVIGKAARVKKASVIHDTPDIRTLINTAKPSRGDTGSTGRGSIIPTDQVPSDLPPVVPTSANFGVPDYEDPDPYGVKALEAKGLFIREAGTKERPSASAFEFRPVRF